MVNIRSRPLPSQLPSGSDVQVLSAAVLLAGLVGAAWMIASLPLPVVTALFVFTATAVVLLRWPWLIWPVLAFCLPVASGVDIGPMTATEVILLFAIGLWIADGARRRTLLTYSSPVVYLVLLYAAVQLLSLLRAPSLGDGIAEVVKWAEFAFVLALLPAMVSRSNALWLSAALVASAAVQAVFGLYQFVFQIGPEWFILLDRYMRASGSFGQPNPYAAYLGVLLPVAVSLALWSWGRVGSRDVDWITKFGRLAFFGLGTALIGAGLLASWSRGGWMAAGTAVVVVLAVRSRRWLGYTLAAIALAFIAAVAGLFATVALPFGLSVRLQGIAAIIRPADLLRQPVTDENFALVERLAHWVAGYRMWESAPWLGVGAGNFASVYDNVRLPLWTEALGHAHNLYLNVLAETGLIGMAAFLAMWIGLAIWTWRHGLARDGESAGWCRAMSAAALGSLAYLTIHSMVDFLFVQGIYLALALVLATLAAGCDEVTEAQ